MNTKRALEKTIVKDRAERGDLEKKLREVQEAIELSELQKPEE